LVLVLVFLAPLLEFLLFLILVLVFGALGNKVSIKVVSSFVLPSSLVSSFLLLEGLGFASTTSLELALRAKLLPIFKVKDFSTS
jgi:hypothetical protein